MCKCGLCDQFSCDYGFVHYCVVFSVDPKNLFVVRKKCVNVDFVVNSHVVISQKQNKHSCLFLLCLCFILLTNNSFT